MRKALSSILESIERRERGGKWGGGGEGGCAPRSVPRALTSKLAKGEKISSEEKERGGKRCALTARINTLAARWSCAGTCRRCDLLQLHHVSIASHINCITLQREPYTALAHHHNHSPQPHPQTTLRHQASPPCDVPQVAARLGQRLAVPGAHPRALVANACPCPRPKQTSSPHTCVENQAKGQAQILQPTSTPLPNANPKPTLWCPSSK